MNEQRKTRAAFIVAQALERCATGSRAGWCRAAHLKARPAVMDSLQIVGEIRRHTIRPRRAAQRGPLQTNTAVFIVILTHRTTALDIGLEKVG